MIEKLPVGYNYSTCYHCGKFIVIPLPIEAGENPIVNEFDFCLDCNPVITCKCGANLKGENTLRIETTELLEYSAGIETDGTTVVETRTHKYIDTLEPEKIFCKKCGVEVELQGEIDYV
jgi:hypothetical protein